MSSKSEREERRAQRAERLQRDKNNEGGFNSYATGKGGYEVDYFKPEKGNTEQIHIIPYLIKSKKHPEVAAGRMKVGWSDYFLEWAQHRDVGPNGKASVLCLDRTFGQPCPICEHLKELQAEGAEKLSWPSQRVMYNVIMVGDRSSKIMVFSVSEALFHRELKSKLSRSKQGFFDFSDLETGSIVEFYVEEKKQGGFTFNTFKDFAFIDRDPLPEDLIDKAFGLDLMINVPTYDQVAKLYSGEIASIDYGANDDYDESTPDARDAKPAAEPAAEPEGQGNTAPPPEEEKEEESKSSGDVTPESLSFGDACPYGLKFGENHDTDRRKCGIDCDDKYFKACKKAKDDR